MDLDDALLKTQKSLGTARRAIHRMETAPQLVEIEDAWESLLYALAQVVKTLAPLGTEPKLKPILKTMESDRRHDPLVTYVYAARNAKDHGVRPVVVPVPASTTFGGTDGTLHIHHLEIGGGSISGVTIGGVRNAVVLSGNEDNQNFNAQLTSPGGGVLIERVPSYMKLVDVFDYKNNRKSVPLVHQGQGISSDILTVARLALSYYAEKYQNILDALA